MERQAVSSSNIASVGYDPHSETLEVEFLKSGKVYEYYNVPAFMHERLMEAPSVGVFFNAEIKNTYACNPL
jgi:KTSC domain